MTTIVITDHDLYLRQSNNVIQYNTNGGSGTWVEIRTFPVTLNNIADTDGVNNDRYIYVTTDITITNVNQYLRLGGSRRFHTVDGLHKVITVQNVRDYGGFIRVYNENELLSPYNITNMCVNVINSNLYIDGNGYGWVCGDRLSSCTVSRCCSNGPINTHCGGIIGGLSNSCNIVDCYSLGNISQDGGGIAGWKSYKITVSFCYSMGSITTGAGGIVGAYSTGDEHNGDTSIDDEYSIVNNCYAMGDVAEMGGSMIGYQCILFRLINCYMTDDTSYGFAGTGNHKLDLLNNVIGNGLDGVNRVFGWFDNAASVLFRNGNNPTGHEDKWLSTDGTVPFVLSAFTRSMFERDVYCRTGNRSLVVDPETSGQSYMLVSPPQNTIINDDGNIAFGCLSQGTYTVKIISYDHINNFFHYFIDSFTLHQRPLIYANTCFTEDAMVLTDNGYKQIINVLESDTIHGKRIVAVTESLLRTIDHLVVIKANAIAKDVPCVDTTVSPSHNIMYNGKLTPVGDLINNTTITKVSYKGEIIYNILLDNYDIMVVNGMIVETLHPSNKLALNYKNVIMTKSDTKVKVETINNECLSVF